MKGNIKNIFIVITIVLCIFILLEVVVDIYLNYFSSEKFFEAYASVKQIARKLNKGKFRLCSHPYTVYALSPGYKKGCNQHNSYGFRGEELGEKQEGEIWIACLGESTTYDYEIECWEKAYPAQLEKYLNEHGIKSRVINAGVDGWTSFEIFIDFSLRVSRFPVDIIIYYGGFNDLIFTRFVYPVKDNPLERDITCARQGVAGMFNYPFWEEISLIRMIKLRTGYAIPHWDRFSMHFSLQNRFNEFVIQLLNDSYPSGIFKDVPVATVLSNNPPIWFEQNITNLVLLAKSRDIIPILTTYFVNKSGVNDHFIAVKKEQVLKFNSVIFPAMQEMNSVIERIGREYNVDCIDLANTYPMNGDLFVDVVHNNEQGAQVKAEMIGKYLIESGIFERVKKRIGR